MKRSTDETARARYEDALRHEGRAGVARPGARHISRRSADALETVHLESVGRESVAPTPSPSSSPNPGANPPGANPSRRHQSRSEAEEAGKARLAHSRHRKAQQKMKITTMLLVIPTAVASVMLMAMAHVVFRDWRSYQSEARIARAQLGALQEQLDTGQRRLGALSSPKGREQILVEHGYIRPGDRLLLFPAEASPEAGAAQASNDIAARRAVRNAASSSAWDRAARTMTGWLGSLSGSSSASNTPKAGASTSTSSSTSTSATPAAGRGAQTSGGSTSSEDAQAADDEGGLSPQDRIVRPAEDASP